MNVQDYEVGSLRPYERNAKKHPQKQIEQIAKSIERFGWAQPLVIDSDHTVIIGHGRLEAAKMLGLDTVPCVLIEDLTEDEVRMLRLADNKLNESEWDFDILAEELEGLDFGDLDLDFGLDTDEEMQEAADDDYTAEAPADPTAKRGDIYRLGRHRVMCGDSTDIKDVKKLLGGGTAEICITSPPYGMANSAKLRKHITKGKRHDDGKTFYGDGKDDADEWGQLMQGFFECAQEVTQSQFINVMMVADNKKTLVDFVHDHEDCLVDIMVWNKHSCPPQMQKNVLNNGYEFVFIFDNDNSSRSIRFGNFKGTYSNYLETKKEPNAYSDVHKAVYSVEFASKIIEINSKAESVYDPFGGTGTTLIACEQMDKTCYMMEMEPKFVDIIIDRWESFTGEKAVKLNG